MLRKVERLPNVAIKFGFPPLNHIGNHSPLTILVSPLRKTWATYNVTQDITNEKSGYYTKGLGLLRLEINGVAVTRH